MLYTFAKAQYEETMLQTILANLTAQDAVLLWQDGVLLAVKFPQIFANHPQIFALENDVMARGIPHQMSLPMLSLSQLVHLTDTYSPQVAL